MHPVLLRLLKLLRGGRGARHVVPAVVLGALAGAVCGWNLTFAVVLTAALLINGPLGATFAAAAIAFIATRAASNLMQTLGGFSLEKLGLGTIVESLGHGPIVSLLGLDDYELVGGAVLALCAALPAAHALARRAGQVIPTSFESDRLLRPYCVPLGAICAILAIVLPSTVGPQLIAQSLLEQWSAVAGAPVTAENITYDLTSGELQLSQLRVHGVSEPGRVMLRVEHAKLRVDPGLLLRGCLHCDEVLLSGIECDTPSSAPTMPAASEPTFLREDTPPGARAAAQPIDVARFVRDWNDVENRLSLIGAMIGSVETVADLETQQTAASRLEAVRRRRTAPLDPLSGKTLPLVQIKSLKVEGLPESWSLGSDASLELVNLTSRTGMTARTTQLTVDAPTCRGRIVVGFRFAGQDRRHDVNTSWDNGSAASIVDARRAAGAGIDVAYAQLVSVRGQGWITRESLDVPLACEVRGVVPAATCGRFGEIDGAVWNAGITRLGGLRFDVGLAGRLRDAKLQITPSSMVVQLKHQLRAAGEHQLVKAVEAGRMTYEAPAPLVAAPTAAPTTVVAKPATLNSATNNASPIAAAVEPSKQPTAATVAAVAPATNAAPTPAAITATPAVAASTTIAPSAVVAVPPAAAVAAAPAMAASTPIPTPTPATAPSIGTAPAAPISSHLASTPVAQPAAAPTFTAPAMPSQNVDPRVPAPTAATVPPVNYGPGGVAVPQPSSTQGLRQPSSVATTSAAPSFVEWSATYQPPRQAFTKPSTPAPQVAAKSRTLTNLPQQPAAPRTAPPTATTPQPKPSAPVEEAKPSLFSRVGGWFNSAEEPPKTAPSVAPPQTPRQPEQPVAESKPYFPRLRSMFAEQEFEVEVVDSVPPIAERSAAIPHDTQPAPSSVPQTAEKSWYQRMFR